MLPKVSIVVATYSRESHLNSLLLSARKAFPPGSFELIAVTSDPDDSKKMAWMLEQPEIVVIRHGQRQPGQPRQCSLYTFENLGIKAARHEWVFVTNDDTLFDPFFYSNLLKQEHRYHVILVNGHIGERGLGCRTVIIGDITPPGCPTRPLFLYDFTIIRKSVYEKIGYLDEQFDWFGKGFDLAMACETTPGLNIAYESELRIDHVLTPENRTPPHYLRDFRYGTNKWTIWCAQHGWRFTWPW